MADPTPNWDDFYDEGLGPDLPLSQAARAQGISGVLPSGEAGGFDFTQQGVGINAPFPHPDLSDEHWLASGTVQTYGPDEGTLVDTERESGIFHFNELLSRFSSASGVGQSGITDFTVFNPYIHHQRLPSDATRGSVIQIPFVSTYNLSIDFNAYNGQRGFGG